MLMGRPPDYVQAGSGSGSSRSLTVPDHPLAFVEAADHGRRHRMAERLPNGNRNRL